METQAAQDSITDLQIEELYEHMASTNTPEYNEDKLIEECLELAEVIMKNRTKAGGPNQPTNEQIAAEAGDVMIRLSVYLQSNGVITTEMLEKALANKLTHLYERKDDPKYKGRL